MSLRLLSLTVSLMVASPMTLYAQSRVDQTPDLGPAAATSFMGDSGLWYVPAAEVLPAGVLSGGLQHATEHRGQNSTKVSYTAAALARGIGGRVELFGSWHVATEIDHQAGRGDALAGIKFNVLSEQRGAPVGLSLRGVTKLPVGSEHVSSGEPDLLTEVVASRRFGLAEATGSTGLIWRGEGEAHTSNGLRSGVGLAIQPHRLLRVFTEIHGEHYRNEGAAARLLSPLDTSVTGDVGFAWQFARNLSASAGISRALGGHEPARGVGVAVRLGYRRSAQRRPRALASAPLTLHPPTPPSPTQSELSARPAPPVASVPQAVQRVEFDDIYFDLDRYTLRPAALPILDHVVASLRNDPDVRLVIEGYTCDLGTTEYNLALSERRASAVRDYLVSRGVSDARLSTVGYGEERYTGEDFAESTRERNRRAAMTVNLMR